MIDIFSTYANVPMQYLFAWDDIFEVGTMRYDELRFGRVYNNEVNMVFFNEFNKRG